MRRKSEADTTLLLRQANVYIQNKSGMPYNAYAAKLVSLSYNKTATTLIIDNYDLYNFFLGVKE
jgi:hypothetical protein